MIIFSWTIQVCRRIPVGKRVGKQTWSPKKTHDALWANLSLPPPLPITSLPVSTLEKRGHTTAQGPSDQTEHTLQIIINNKVF